jgi:hypothetical protein
MAAVVCPYAINLKASGIAADGFALFKHRGAGDASSRKLIRSTDTGRTRS